MNAYELADYIKENYATNNNDIDKLANMLRQQASELDKVIPQLVKANGIIENLKIRIAELENQAKPVAWMQMHHKDNITTKFSPVKVWEDDIPLYTTPQTKPLSAEDIAEMVCSGEYWKVDGLTILSVDFDKFARAIEERHGIK